MSVRVNLFFLSDVRYGGWVSYTTHLFRTLQQQGLEPHLFKIGKKDEGRTRIFPHTGDITYRNVTIDTAMRLAESPTLITAMAWRKSHHNVEALLNVGSALVLHDPTEFSAALFAMLIQHKTKVIAIRQSVEKLLVEAGLDATFIPHPYVRAAPTDTHRRRYPMSFSRLDYDKHTELIAEANTLLPLMKRIRIYGAENRLFTHHKLNDAWPKWRDCYLGTFDDALKLARSATYAVDMSIISKDGGGTQYTFMEAWDVGCPLIVNRGWLLEGGALQEGVNCLAADTGLELSDLVRGDYKAHGDVVSAGYQHLTRHGPDVVGPQYRSVMFK